jgi:hypothetical protein
MSNVLPQPEKANAFFVIASVFNAALHVRLALPHNLAAELESSQIATEYQSGLYPPVSWEADTRAQVAARLKTLRWALFKSFLLALLSLWIFIGLAVLFGKVNPTQPPDYGKVTTTIGITTAAWAGFLQLSPIERTFRGTFLHETAYDLAFKVLTVLGVLLAGLGGLWWQ